MIFAFFKKIHKKRTLQRKLQDDLERVQSKIRALLYANRQLEFLMHDQLTKGTSYGERLLRVYGERVKQMEQFLVQQEAILYELHKLD